jgi:hypothetical protein
MIRFAAPFLLVGGGVFGQTNCVTPLGAAVTDGPVNAQASFTTGAVHLRRV